MSDDSPQQPGRGPADPPGARGAPSEQELQAAYEAELSRITATDMIAQSAVSLLNIGARRLGGVGDPSAPEGAQGGPPRDLDQVRDAIDGARALLGILERTIPGELGPLRDALSQLQMAYAREVGGAPGASQPADRDPAPSPAGGATAPTGSTASGEQKPGAGPAESSGRLWVPGR